MSGVFGEKVAERCCNCTSPAVGSINGTPFCANESCIEKAVNIHAEPITAAFKRLQEARARRGAK